ncbi:unnamed protein product [Euphydryas editha]|uniref:C2H2-type domain-containing protein n=1 Tax=Euphydryas editha TaxID=104508 RepID=A0AAU9UCT6_EUPED|nr:unnamed protein product [Euphydryas editha]
MIGIYVMQPITLLEVRMVPKIVDLSLSSIETLLFTKIKIGEYPGKKLFSCTLCAKVLCSKASLKRHIADKHAERQEEYRCSICDRVYCSRNSLMTHIYTYHKSRPGEMDQIKFF